MEKHNASWQKISILFENFDKNAFYRKISIRRYFELNKRHYIAKPLSVWFYLLWSIIQVTKLFFYIVLYKFLGFVVGKMSEKIFDTSSQSIRGCTYITHAYVARLFLINPSPLVELKRYRKEFKTMGPRVNDFQPNLCTFASFIVNSMATL